MKKFLACVLAALAFLTVPASADAARKHRATDSGATLAVEINDGIAVFTGCGYAPSSDLAVYVASNWATTFMGVSTDAAGCFTTADRAFPADPSKYVAWTVQDFTTREALASLTFTVTE